jgi:hypothetical protein
MREHGLRIIAGDKAVMTVKGGGAFVLGIDDQGNGERSGAG